MLRRFSFLCALIFAVTVLCGGCLSRPASTDLPKGSKTVTLPDKSESVEEVSAEDKLYSALEDNFDSGYVMINTYTMRIGYTDAEEFIITHMRYVKKAEKLRELLPAALRGVYDRARELYPDKTVIHIENINYPSWQYLAATMYFAESERFLLYDIMGISITTEERDDSLIITVNANPTDIRTFADKRAGEQADDLSAANIYNSVRYTYAYLTALYDEEGASLIPEPTASPDNTDITEPTPTPEPSYYPFTDEYKSGLCYPLDNVPDFRDSWAQGRSNNTRLHMGTDIPSREGYNIYACASGTVLYKGFDKIPGNFLIIMDDYGFEYHYYHLVEIPSEVSPGDRVTAGDIIAHVGNTGNSDSAHLHVAMIDPDGVFINPFRMLKNLAEKTPH